MSEKTKAEVKRDRLLAQYKQWADDGLFDAGKWVGAKDGKVLMEALEVLLTRNYGRIEEGEIKRVLPEDLHWWCEVGVARDPEGIFETKEKKPGVFVLDPKNVKIVKRVLAHG